MSLVIDASFTTPDLIRPNSLGANLILNGGTGGSVSILRGTPTNGAGIGITLYPSAGVGTNRAGGAISITGGNATGTGNAGSITITAGNYGTSGIGSGRIDFTGGAGNGATTGGSVTVTGGSGGTTGTGANVLIFGGAGGSTSGNGSDPIVKGGNATSGVGGTVNITGSSGVGTNRSGGNVNITTGAKTGTGTAGLITFAGTSSGLVLPTNAVEASITTDGAIYYNTTSKVVRARRYGVWTDFFGREPTETTRTFYVRTDGSDSNDGLSNTAGGAWATLQHAWDVLAYNYDGRSNDFVVQIADGTYTSGLNAFGLPPGQTRSNNITFQGNATTPANVVISTTNIRAIQAGSGARVTVKDLKVTTTTAGHGILAFYPGSLVLFLNIDFGTIATNYAHVCADRGGRLSAIGDYTISGNATYHMLANAQGFVQNSNNAVTLSGSRTFSIFAIASLMGTMECTSTTFTGTATGKRYESNLMSFIGTFGGTTTLFPGNVAGTLSNGGQYQA